MGEITSSNLQAEILTQRLPLSDSFNRAVTAVSKAGVHHGLQLIFNHVNWPLGDYTGDGTADAGMVFTGTRHFRH